MSPSILRKVPLVSRINGRMTVEGTLEEGLDETHVDEWFEKWRPVYDEIRQTRPRGEWPASAHWDWSQKLARVSGLAAYRGYSIRYDGALEGMMIVSIASATYTAMAEGAKGKPIVYVEYIEAAPWNQPWHHERRLAGVGSNLLNQAVALSDEEELSGRVGLHALPASEPFYLAQQMRDFGPDSRKAGLRYFEYTAEVLDEMLSS